MDLIGSRQKGWMAEIPMLGKAQCVLLASFCMIHPWEIKEEFQARAPSSTGIQASSMQEVQIMQTKMAQTSRMEASNKSLQPHQENEKQEMAMQTPHSKQEPVVIKKGEGGPRSAAPQPPV